MDSTEEAPLPPFFKKLADDFGKPRQFRASYRLSTEPGKIDHPNSVFGSLELDAKVFSPIAKEALDALDAEHEAKWVEFKWKLDAFNQIQDIFDAVLFESEASQTIFHQYYFYYESRYILAESILCGLNGFYIASQALLRPFLEFSLLQNYYCRLTNLSRSYKDLEKYFKNAANPSWGTVLKKALPKDSFSKPIRSRIQSHLAGLSESVLHPYHPDHSTLQHKSPESIHSIEGVYFWYTTQLIVEAALWLYYTNFPLLFHPIPTLRKFGYRGPVGIVIDETAGFIVQKSLIHDDYQNFKAYSLAQEKTREVLAWLKDFPDLSDEEIQATWNPENGKFPGLWEGHAQTMAQMRGLKGALALRQRSEEATPVSEKFLAAITSLNGWQKLTAKGFHGQRKK